MSRGTAIFTDDIVWICDICGDNLPTETTDEDKAQQVLEDNNWLFQEMPVHRRQPGPEAHVCAECIEKGLEL